MIKGNLMYGQSGGPSPVINASAYGVIKEALNIPSNESTELAFIDAVLQPYIDNYLKNNIDK